MLGFSTIGEFFFFNDILTLASEDAQEGREGALCKPRQSDDNPSVTVHPIRGHGNKNLPDGEHGGLNPSRNRQDSR